MRIISEQLIRDLHIAPRTCVEWVRESFAMKPLAQLPAKSSVHPLEGEFINSMPCLLPAPEALPAGTGKARRHYFGIKVVHRLNAAVPSLGGDMLLYDARTGELLALVDADWVTMMRTGAVTAVAAKALRKSSADCYGFIGLGNTARASLLCVLEQEPEKSFHVQLVRYKDQAERFMERFAGFRNVEFEIVDNVVDVAHDVDVFISCITRATEMLVPDDTTFQPGATVIPVHSRGLQCCDTTFDRVFGDDTDHLRGFRYFSQFRGYNEIGEVLAGRDLGRTSDEQRILNYNCGLGLHDVVYASRIYEMLEAAMLPEVERIKETAKFWV